ncbi:MAG: exodeoxyribonuclease VII small subunit [Erysipelotrichaceae bacterium]
MKEDSSFKTRMQRLEEISNALEKNDIELESAITLFEEGLQLVNHCDQQLKGFENKVEELLNTYQGGNGDENL